MRRVLVLLALALAACGSPFEIEVPAEEPRLVVEALFSADSVLTFELRRSASAFDSLRSDAVRGATVEVLEDGVPVGTAAFVAARNRYVSDVRPRPGHTLGLRVSAPGFAPVEAEDDVPEPVPFEVVAVERGEGPADRTDAVTIRFTDPPGADRYALYGIAVRTLPGRPNGTQRFPIPLRSAEPALTDGFFSDLIANADAPFYQRAFFRDVPFAGQTVTLRLEVQRRVIDGDPLPLAESLRLARLSATYYDYVRAREADRSGPLGDPVRLPSNVTGGYGIFAALTPTEVALP